MPNTPTETAVTASDAHGAGTLRTLLRLMPWVRPALSRIILGMVVALLAGLVSLAIPLILQNLVDGPLSTRDGAQIWPAAILVLVLGVLEACLIAARRFLVLTPGTQVEAAMRNAFYAKLQDLPVSFHDRWQSGQLLSRAMSDLNLVRRWLSFGVVLLIVNIVTIAVTPASIRMRAPSSNVKKASDAATLPAARSPARSTASLQESTRFT